MKIRDNFYHYIHCTCEGDFSGDLFGFFDGELNGERFTGDVSASKDGGSFVSHDDPALTLTEDSPSPCESPTVPNVHSSVAAAKYMGVLVVVLGKLYCYIAHYNVATNLFTCRTI